MRESLFPHLCREGCQHFLKKPVSTSILDGIISNGKEPLLGEGIQRKTGENCRSQTIRVGLWGKKMSAQLCDTCRKCIEEDTRGEEILWGCGESNEEKKKNLYKHTAKTKVDGHRGFLKVRRSDRITIGQGEKKG